jgi:hypothetical protein
MEEHDMSWRSNRRETRSLGQTGVGLVIRVAAESQKYQDWELIGPNGEWLMCGRPQPSHEAALSEATRLQAQVYPHAEIVINAVHGMVTDEGS